ncbi:uncharacterized protein LODBEIA_P42220 [Lodderomyces beijingensis]|uniref:Mediator of RNA polymerase II transcription subunit 19 n=1 Tax=Lodderomyces beijingensis TaxID=1775926 RepID=A0ABP0ZPB4_9ASCO
MQAGDQAKQEFYLIDTASTPYKPSSPTPLQNLLHLYNLEETARQLARTNPDGSKNVKLRKSYKAHIQDLPGKHQIPPSKQIAVGLMDPMIAQYPDIIEEIDAQVLAKALHFDKTPLHGIPGFDPADLAITADSGAGDDDDERKGKRKKKLGGAGVGSGGDLKRQRV